MWWFQSGSILHLLIFNLLDSLEFLSISVVVLFISIEPQLTSISILHMR